MVSVNKKKKERSETIFKFLKFQNFLHKKNNILKNRLINPTIHLPRQAPHILKNSKHTKKDIKKLHIFLSNSTGQTKIPVQTVIIFVYGGILD